MAVYRNRSTTSVPASLSISYLIGSPPTGTSMMTLTSRGGSIPIEMASMRMDGSAGRVEVKSWIRTRRGPGPVSRRFETPRNSMGPGEGDLVERLGPDLVAEHQHADAAALADRAIPPLRAAPVDQLLQLRAGNDALIGRAPGFVMGGRYRGCVCSFGRPNLDQGCAHGSDQSKSARRRQGPSLIIS